MAKGGKIQVDIDLTGRKKFESEIKGMTAKTSGNFKKLRNSVKGVVTSLKGILPALGAVAVVLALKNITKAAFDLEHQLAEVSTLLGDNRHKLGELEAGLKKLSKEVPQSLGELTTGLYQVLSAGIAVDDALEVLRISARAATGGLTSVTTSTEGLTKVMNAYSLGAKDATKVADLMFQTVKYGSLTFEQLSSSIGTVAGTAALGGVQLEELFAAIATGSKTMRSAREVSTALRMVIMSFIKPSEDAVEVAKEYGFELNALTLQNEGLLGAMRLITQAYNKAKSEGKDAVGVLGKMIPSVEAIALVVELAGENFHKFSASIDTMNESATASTEAFDIMAATMNARLDMLKNQFSILKTEVGTFLGLLMGPEMVAVLSFLDMLNNLIAKAKAGTPLGPLLGPPIPIDLMTLDQVKSRMEEIESIEAKRVQDIREWLELAKRAKVLEEELNEARRKSGGMGGVSGDADGDSETPGRDPHKLGFEFWYDLAKAWEGKPDEVVEDFNYIEEFGVQAAHNIQDAFGDAFFEIGKNLITFEKSFQKIIQSILASFLSAMWRMIAEAAALKLLMMMSGMSGFGFLKVLGGGSNISAGGGFQGGFTIPTPEVNVNNNITLMIDGSDLRGWLRTQDQADQARMI